MTEQITSQTTQTQVQSQQLTPEQEAYLKLKSYSGTVPSGKIAFTQDEKALSKVLGVNEGQVYNAISQGYLKYEYDPSGSQIVSVNIGNVRLTPSQVQQVQSLSEQFLAREREMAPPVYVGVPEGFKPKTDSAGSLIGGVERIPTQQERTEQEMLKQGAIFQTASGGYGFADKGKTVIYQPVQIGLKGETIYKPISQVGDVRVSPVEQIHTLEKPEQPSGFLGLERIQENFRREMSSYETKRLRGEDISFKESVKNVGAIVGSSIVSIPFGVKALVNLSIHPIKTAKALPKVPSILLEEGSQFGEKIRTSPLSATTEVVKEVLIFKGLGKVPKVLGKIEDVTGLSKYDVKFLSKTTSISEAEKGIIEVNLKSDVGFYRNAPFTSKSARADLDVKSAYNLVLKDENVALFKVSSTFEGKISDVALDVLTGKRVALKTKDIAGYGFDEAIVSSVKPSFITPEGIKVTLLDKDIPVFYSKGTSEAMIIGEEAKRYINLAGGVQITRSKVFNAGVSAGYKRTKNDLIKLEKPKSIVTGVTDIKPKPLEYEFKPQTFDEEFGLLGERDLASNVVKTDQVLKKQLVNQRNENILKALEEQRVEQIVNRLSPVVKASLQPKELPLKAVISSVAGTKAVEITKDISIPTATSVYYGRGLYERTETSFSPALAIKQQEKQLTSLVSLVGLREQQKQYNPLVSLSKQNMIETNILRARQIPIQAQGTNQRQAQLFRLITGQVPRTPATPTPMIPPRVPRIRIPVPDFDIRGIANALKIRRAYSVLLKRRGQYVPIAKGLPRGKALAFLEKGLLSDLARTGKLVQSGTTTEQDINKYMPREDIFRSYRIRRGRKIALVNEIIQRQRKSLVSQIERQLIQQARIQAQRFRKRRRR